MMVVDTCVILDVLMNDPAFGQRSLSAIEEYADGGLLITPVSFVELAPAFLGDVNREKQFLFELGIDLPNGFDTSDIPLAHAAWYRHIQKKRQGKSPRRPIADVLIGALAQANDGLITRNAKDFKALFPNLNIIVPR